MPYLRQFYSPTVFSSKDHDLEVEELGKTKIFQQCVCVLLGEIFLTYCFIFDIFDSAQRKEIF